MLKFFFSQNITVDKKRKFNEEEIKIIEENKFNWAEAAKKIPWTSQLKVKNFYSLSLFYNIVFISSIVLELYLCNIAPKVTDSSSRKQGET